MRTEIIKITTVDTQSGSAAGTVIARSLPAVLCLLLALALGAALPFVTSLPKTWAVLVCLAICGGFAAVVMFSVNLPLVPILRLLLLASSWLYMEINFFPILKNHAEPPGLNISLTLILSLLLGGVWLMERRRSNEREPVFPRLFALTLVGTLLWCSLTVAYGAEGMLGIYGLWTTAASILICFVAAAHFSDRRVLHQMLVIIAVLITFNAIFGIAQALFPSLPDFAISDKVVEPPVMIEGEEVSRVRALSGPSNTFAWNLVVFLPIVVAPLLLRTASLRRRRRALCAVAVVLGVIALILTYSRGSWIAFAASLPLMAVSAFFILEAEERRRMVFRLAGAAAMISLLAIPFSGKIISRLTDDDRGAAEVRLPLIQVALAMIADNPVLGVGLGSYESVMRRYDETPELVTEHFDWPVHNLYLHIAAETGLPGLLLFLALTVMASRRGWMVLRNSGADPMLRALALGLLGGMAAYLITGIKEGSCFQTGMMRPFFLLCGLMLGNERASRKTAE